VAGSGKSGYDHVSGGSASSLSHATALIILSSVKLSISLSDADSYRKIQKDAKMYQNFIIPYLYEARYVSGDTPPIIRSLKLHVQQPSTYEKPEAASAVLGS